MLHVGYINIEQIVLWVAAIVAPIIYIAAVIQHWIIMMRNGETVIFPTAVFRALENQMVAGRCSAYTCIDLVQFLVPPPYVFMAGIPPNALIGYAFSSWCFVPVISAIKHHRQVELFQIRQALGLDCLGFCI